MTAAGRIDKALAYAEASRRLNQADGAIDAACEKILLGAGRIHEAYEKYALTANISSAGLATFRAISRKYPSHDPKKILSMTLEPYSRYRFRESGCVPPDLGRSDGSA